MHSILLGVLLIAETTLAAACGGPVEPATRTFDLEIQDSSLVGESTFTVTQGDTVVLHLTADEAGRVHVHGYGEEVEVGPDAPAELSFVADATGRFDLSMHVAHSHEGGEGHSHEASGDEEDLMLGVIEVRPR